MGRYVDLRVRAYAEAGSGFCTACGGGGGSARHSKPLRTLSCTWRCCVCSRSEQVSETRRPVAWTVTHPRVIGCRCTVPLIPLRAPPRRVVTRQGRLGTKDGWCTPPLPLPRKFTNPAPILLVEKRGGFCPRLVAVCLLFPSRACRHVSLPVRLPAASLFYFATLVRCNP